MTTMTMTLGASTNLRAARDGVVPDATGLTLRGHYLPTSDAVQAAAALRQQLRGYATDGDVPFVPFTCSADASLTGFYRVTSADLLDQSVFGSGVLGWTARLERLTPSDRLPLQDCPGVTLTRTNDHTISNQSGQWSVPATAVAAYPPGNWSKDLTPATRTADTGALTTHFFNAGSTPAAAQARFICDPADFYVGAATVKSKLSGSSYYTMVGRTAPLTPDNWRLDNGLLRLTGSSSAGTLFTVSCYNGSSWGSASVTITADYRSQVVTDAFLLTASTPQVVGVQVLKNSPAVCVVRLWWRFTTASAGSSRSTRLADEARMKGSPRALDLTIRRGDRIASAYLSTGSGNYTRIYDQAGTATTSLTGGSRFTSNDANGNRFVLATLDNDASFPGRGSPWGWGVGYEVGGSSATGQETAQEVAYQFFSQFVETQRVAL